MKKSFLTLLIVAFASLAMSAQSPVRWRLYVNMTSSTQGEICMKALISDGWHLYGLSLPKGGPKPTTFDFSASNGIKLDGQLTPSELPNEQFDPLFGVKLSWWDRNVTFTQPFTLTNKNDAIVKVSVSYMSCNGESCTPPKTDSVSAEIPEYNPSQLSQRKK